jgi:hypothetical protein
MSNKAHEEIVDISAPAKKGDLTKESKKQQPLLGITAGILAAAIGATLWILIAQKYQLTWMSAAVAFGIASAIRYAGKAKDFRFGIVGAFLSIIVALIGNLATAIFIVSKRGKTPSELLSQLDVSTAITFLKALSGPMGIVFYIAVIYIGFWFSFKHASKKPVEIE